MNDIIDFYVPKRDEFCRGCSEYNKKEKRGSLWFEASDQIRKNWGNSSEMAKGISWLMRSWNRFYSNFDFDELTECIKRNVETLEGFRNRCLFR